MTTSDRVKRILAFLAAGLLACSGQARAENLIGFEVRGTVSHVYDQTDYFAGAIQVGAPFVVYLTYDLDTPATEIRPSFKQYYHPDGTSAGLTLTVSGLTFATETQFGVGVFNDDAPIGADFFRAFGSGPVPLDVDPSDYTSTYTQLRLLNKTETALTDTSLPTELDLADWLQGVGDYARISFSLEGPGSPPRIAFYGAIESITPSVASLIEQLIVDVLDINLANGVANSLDAKLDNALDAWFADNAEQRNDVINKMEAFINAVEAQRGKKIGDADADYLVGQAQVIIGLLL